MSTKSTFWTRNKKLIVLLTIGLLIIWIGTVAYVHYWTPKLYELATEEQITNASQTSNSQSYPRDWLIYSSSRYHYSFQYPPQPVWLAHFYDEGNPKTVVGTHTISNYDSEVVKKYMDHGKIDWANFLENKPAIKLEIDVAKLNYEKEAFIKGRYTGGHRKVELNNPIAQVEIGDLRTEVYEYIGRYRENNERDFEFVAFPDSQNVITVRLMVFNISPNTEISSLEEWKDVQLMLESFNFN